MKENTYYYHAVATNGLDFYLFSEWNHIFPQDTHIVGKVIYVSSDSMGDEKLRFKTKRIGNREYINLAYSVVNGETVIRADHQIKTTAEKLLFSTDEHIDLPMNASDLVTKVPVTWIDGCYEARSSLVRYLKSSPETGLLFDEILNRFSILPDNLGLTGSAVLGASSVGDIDVVFYGNAEELKSVLRVIQQYQRKNGVVCEHGLAWPVRFYSDTGELVCGFFNMVGEDYLPYDVFKTEKLPKRTRFKVTVEDDTFTMAKTPLYKTTGTHERLLLLSSGFKGAVVAGDCIEGYGYECSASRFGDSKLMVCLNPFQDIDDALAFFSPARVLQKAMDS